MILLFMSTVNFPYLYLLAPIINRMAWFSVHPIFQVIYTSLIFILLNILLALLLKKLQPLLLTYLLHA